MKKIFAAILGVGLLVVAPAAIWASSASDDANARVLRLLTKYLPLRDSSDSYGDRAFAEHFRKDDPQYEIVFDEGAASKGILQMQADGTAVDTSAINLTNLGYYGNGKLAFRVADTTGSGAQTILPVMAAEGLDISGDATDTEGYHVYAGVEGTSGRPMVIGRDPAFYFCAVLELADASDTDDLHVGWHSFEAALSSQLYNNFSHYASIGLVGEVDPNTIFIETSNASDVGEASTDTTNTWADAAEKELCVYVSATGVVTYTINGAAPTTTAAFTFTDGLAVLPTIWFVHGTSSSAGVVLKRWTVRYQ